ANYPCCPVPSPPLGSARGQSRSAGCADPPRRGGSSVPPTDAPRSCFPARTAPLPPAPSAANRAGSRRCRSLQRSLTDAGVSVRVIPHEVFERRVSPIRRDAEGDAMVEPTWETVTERLIREAQERGEFADLPHHGKPLPSRNNPYVGEMGLAYDMLQD